MTDSDHTRSSKPVKKSNDFRALFKEMNKRGVFVPRTFIDLTGDTQVASFLSQVMYWSEHTSDPDGWFYKKYDDWKTEIGLSKFQVSRCASKLKPFGLETKLKKAGKAPTVHYRIVWDIFEETYRRFMDSQETGLSTNLTIQSSSDSQVSRLSSFSIVNSEETSLSSYIDYIHREEEYTLREKILNEEIASLKAQIAELQKVIDQVLPKPQDSVFGSKDPQTEEIPSKEKPYHRTFNQLALDCFSLQENQVNGAEGRIVSILHGRTGKNGYMGLWKLVYPNQPYSPEHDHQLAIELAATFQWWRETKSKLSVPTSSVSIWKALVEYRGCHSKPANLDENGYDITKYERNPNFPDLVIYREKVIS